MANRFRWFACDFAGFGVRAWVYLFRGPHSYTGEDVAEFHIPGNPLLARMLLDELIARGARLAEAGEFTARAYFNGRLDLSQAEGVAATIAAGNEDELRAARQLLAGELARRVKPAMELLADTLALVEVGIDFSEEDVSFLSGGEIRERLLKIDGMLEGLLRESARFERLHHVPTFVLVGRPNAGKSTLLNALAGEERAVVSEVAGTTRDALSAEVGLARGMVRVVDVAGIETLEKENEIERQMRGLAMEMVESADHVVLVKECGDEREDLGLSRQAGLVVWSKWDLVEGVAPSPGTPGEGGGEGLSGPVHQSSPGEPSLNPHPNPRPVLRERGQEAVGVSTRTGEGMSELRRRLDELAFGKSSGATLAINSRHIRAIESAREAIGRAMNNVDGGAEVLAVELREGLDLVGEVFGAGDA